MCLPSLSGNVNGTSWDLRLSTASARIFFSEASFTQHAVKGTLHQVKEMLYNYTCVLRLHDPQLVKRYPKARRDGKFDLEAPCCSLEQLSRSCCLHLTATHPHHHSPTSSSSVLRRFRVVWLALPLDTLGELIFTKVSIQIIDYIPW